MSSCRTRDIPEGWGGDVDGGSAFLEGWTD